MSTTVEQISSACQAGPLRPDYDADDVRVSFRIDQRGIRTRDPEMDCVRIHGTIHDIEDENLLFGQVEASLVRLYQEGVNFHDALDAPSHHTAELLDLLGEDGIREDVCEMVGLIHVDQILLLEEINVDEAFRGHAIGLAAARITMDTFASGVDILVACKPFPLQYSGKAEENEKEFRRCQRKLRSYWSRLGLRRVRKTELYVTTAAAYHAT